MQHFDCLSLLMASSYNIHSSVLLTKAQSGVYLQLISWIALTYVVAWFVGAVMMTDSIVNSTFVNVCSHQESRINTHSHYAHATSHYSIGAVYCKRLSMFKSMCAPKLLVLQEHYSYTCPYFYSCDQVCCQQQEL